jgi:hypothetical protein
VHVAPLGPGAAELRRAVGRRGDDRVQLLLLGRESTRGRIRAGDVAGVAAVLAAGVDQDELALGDPARCRREVEHRRVGATADDRVECEEVGAAPEERRLELYLKLALAPARLDQRRYRGETGAGRPLGGTHACQLDGVLLATDVVQAIAQVGLELSRRRQLRQRSAETGHRTALALLEPAGELGHRHSLRRVGCGALPQAFLAGHRHDEVDPALVRVEGQDAARPLAVGQIEVLRVRAERVGAVAAAGDRDPVPGTDQHDLVIELPAPSSRAPPTLELGGDRGSVGGDIGCGGGRRLGHALSLRAADCYEGETD